MNKFLKILISSIYPNRCICCGEIIDEDAFICDKCDTRIERNDIKNYCFDCGFEKDECACKYNVYRFTSSVSAFKNEAYAQKAYYAYKFYKKQNYCQFFVDELSNVINTCYNDADFDFICYVPSYNRRGYNHSGYIAKAISKNLNIPFYNDLLYCVKKCKKQHKSSIKERINNVDGKYAANYRIDQKRVLLIDDIKTTGSTLDECARVLLFAGAQSVHCATVLGSSSKNQLKNK